MKNSPSLTLSYDTLSSRCSWLLFAALLIAVSLFVSSLADKNSQNSPFQNQGFRVVSECIGSEQGANKVLFADHSLLNSAVLIDEADMSSAVKKSDCLVFFG